MRIVRSRLSESPLPRGGRYNVPMLQAESTSESAPAAPPDGTGGIDAHLSRFGLSSLRPGQREVISAVIDKQDCPCIMRTGGGKSLCYQLPAVMRAGLT